MNIGRNDPCPCGSGKKYKRCCLPKIPVQDHEDMIPIQVKSKPALVIVLVNEIRDYGVPKVDDDFFTRNPFDDENFVAQRSLYSCMVRPEVEALAEQISKQFIFRGQDEAKRIRETKDTAGLVAILKQEPDPLNHSLLRRKLLKLQETAVPLLADELRHVQNDCFTEQAVRIIYASKIDCSSALLKLIESTSMDAYALSLVCLLLGMIGPRQALKPLWDRFHFFNERYPQENFSQGPLIGLHELSKRIEKGAA